ncbi:MAG TPA: S-adenosylmethionine:tRNA ribosyltransferase-isomerase [Candidatus Absconditabacterales bacterium]|nr:S-adenosylmethionine:tRNA ribosyltransferase-isomerase [Candidatus Absconditabacterales bacterium]HNG96653.1 S-adenosylmethionine:tRNA ribosyltransferase-isomerase [Candidatus Absconditabacterales bacterium]
MSLYALDSYEYLLPDQLIAQLPHNPPDQCRLLVVDTQNATWKHDRFDTALIQGLNTSSVLFFNTSKVVKARIPLDDALIILSTGTVIPGISGGELLYLTHSSDDGCYEFLVKPGSKLKPGTRIIITKNNVLYTLDIREQSLYGRIIYYSGSMFNLLDEVGQMPLPPYIEYNTSKESSYQPVMATTPGSVASPTASLHFTHNLLTGLSTKGVITDQVTLHVGLGTFKSIQTNDVRDHQIHNEQAQVDLGIFERIMNYKLTHKTIVAVGTTTTRTLESLPYLFQSLRQTLSDKLSSDIFDYWSKISVTHNPLGIIYSPTVVGDNIVFGCQLYITPGFHFCIIDQLITNFHLPKSSLMVLVASMMGHDLMMKVYQDAVSQQYMFYSFGDAMWIR